MDNRKPPMSKDEYLKAMSDAIKRRAGEEVKEEPESERRSSFDFIMPKVGPGKVDPEREAEATMIHRIQNRINPQTGLRALPDDESVVREGETQNADKARILKAMQGDSSVLREGEIRRSKNRINPETGMPFYSEPEEIEEDPQAVQQREIRMQMLQEAAKTGKMPEYLKKY
jgi:hypothetical protein